jgi:nitroreductase
MDTFETIYARRAVKNYDPNFVIPAEDITKMFEAAIQSPTSSNIQHWRFVMVDDKELKEKICAAAYNQQQVKDASIAVIMTADVKAYKKDPARYWMNTSPEVQNHMTNAILGFHEGNEQIQRDEAIRSTGLAGMTLMLAAKAMGYDSNPMRGFDADAVGKLINLPEDHLVSFMIVIGKGIKPAHPKPGQLSLDEVLIHNHF